MTAPPTAWQEYLAAAQRLDAVRRAQASAAAAATRQISSARAELREVQERLQQQQAALADAAAGYRVAPPQLSPLPADVTVAAELARDPAAVPEALRHSRELVDATDARLARPSRARWWRWRPRRRRERADPHPPI